MSKYPYILLTKEKWWDRRVDQSRAGKKIQAFVRKNACARIIGCPRLLGSGKYLSRKIVDKLL